MEQEQPPPGTASTAADTLALRTLVAELEAAMRERQLLLAGRDAPAVRPRIDALGWRVAELLDQIAAVYPPAALDVQAVVSGEFDRFLDRGGAQRRAG